MSTPPGLPVNDGPRASRVCWHLSDNAAEWTAACAAAIAASIDAALREDGDVHLLLSGGSTPAPVYRALAATPVAWARVVIGLVDDRDVEPDADGSNARLVRETLLQGNAAAARFDLLRAPRQALDEAVRVANARWHDGAEDGGALAAGDAQRRAHRVAVLGMGDDGHTASLFPGAIDLPAAFASDEPYATIDATGCAVAGAHPHRISLTPRGLSQTGPRLLLVRGEAKRETLRRALGDGPASAMPIRCAIDRDDAPLQIHWCP